MTRMGDSEMFYMCSECRTPVASSINVISKRFHGFYGAAYLFDQVQNITSGEERTSQMTTGEHGIKTQYCSGCQKELGWAYVWASDSSQAYKVGKIVLERNLLSTRSRKGAAETKDSQTVDTKAKDSTKGKTEPKISKTSGPPKPAGQSSTAAPSSEATTTPAQLYSSEFMLTTGILLVSPSSTTPSDLSAAHIYLPDKALPTCAKKSTESAEDAAMRCAAAASSSSHFMHSRDPIAITCRPCSSTTNPSLKLELVQWFMFTTSSESRDKGSPTMDWVSYSQAISTCVSTKDADLLVKAGEIYRLRSEAAATSHGEEAVFLDGTWDLVDEDGDDMLVDKATALRVA